MRSVAGMTQPMLNMMEYQDSRAMGALTRKMWGEVLTWLSAKFRDVCEEDLEDGQLLALHAAMRFEEECRFCIDVAQCPHSRAALVVREVSVRGRRGFEVCAKVCDFLAGRYEEEKARDLFAESGIPTARRGSTFDEFNTLGCAQVLQGAKAIAMECVQKRRGLILGGPVGSGKTHLAIAMGLAALGDGRSVRFALMPDLFERLRKEMIDNSSQLLDEMKNCDLLILDDCGTERVTNWNDETLFVIIDWRSAHDLPVVVTTNAVGEEGLSGILKGERGVRIFSRLMAMTEQVWMVGVQDYRRRER